jgi:predicted dithiol-disulfide oxidoreductase (DUF899 family)/uncharacterized protein YndB with AHSA1/START domain
MTVTAVRKDPQTLSMTLEAEFDASPDRVWQLWADPRQLERWWGPPTYPATFTKHDLAPGSRVEYHMTGPEGDKSGGYWEVLEAELPRRLVFRDGFLNADGTANSDLPVNTANVRIEPAGNGRTRMSIESVFPSTEAMEQVLGMGMEEGLTQAVGQIDAILAEAEHPLPPIVDRPTWQAKIDELRLKEKAHTRAGDALAAERRRLPIVEVDPRTPLIGADGPVPLIDIFDGRSQLIAYYHMWHPGRPAAEQCEGCTFNTSHVTELSYLHSRDVSYAVLCEGPYAAASRYRDFMSYPAPWYSVPPDSADRLIADRDFGMLVCYVRDGERVYETYWTTGRGDEVMAPSYGLLDRTVYGRQEFWEDSPRGWPRRWGSKGGQFRLNGRPTAQWRRLEAGRNDDLSPGTSA